MKPALLAISTFLSAVLLSQENFEGRWIPQFGASTFVTAFKENTMLNVRCVSPRFRISNEDWTAEEEKEPERFKNGRLMLELFYAAPLRFLGASFNIQCRFMHYKRFTMEIYGWPKFFFISPPDFILNQNSSASKKDSWFINFGLTCQFDLGKLKPYADIGRGGMLTVGTEVDVQAIFKKIRKKYAPPYLREG